MICPDCGAQLPKSGICYNCKKNLIDSARFGRGTGTLPAYIRYGRGGSGKRYVDHGPPGKINQKQSRQEQKLTLATVQSLLPKRPLTGQPLARQQRGMNRFLLVIFEKPLLISDVLRSRGFTVSQIAELRARSAEFLARFMAKLYKSWNLVLTPRQILILTNYFSLNGEAMLNREDLADKLDITPNAVKLQLDNAKKILRLPHNRQIIDRSMYDTARQILDKSSTGNRRREKNR